MGGSKEVKKQKQIPVSDIHRQGKMLWTQTTIQEFPLNIRKRLFYSKDAQIPEQFA